MFPFENRFQWIWNNRQVHFIEITHDHLDRVQEPYQAVVALRTAAMRRWLRIRAVLFALLYFGLIASVAGWVLDRIPDVPFLRDSLDIINSIARTLTGVFTVAVILVLRYIGQLEADIIGCLAVGTLPPDEIAETE